MQSLQNVITGPSVSPVDHGLALQQRTLSFNFSSHAERGAVSFSQGIATSNIKNEIEQLIRDAASTKHGFFATFGRQRDAQPSDR